MSAPKKKKAVRVTARTLLVELGTEELPPRALRSLSEAFAESLFAALEREGLVQGSYASCERYATPRRLAVRVPGVSMRQPDRVQERRGPALAAAFDAAGNPSKAAQGFAGSCGVTVEKLDRLETEKGSWLVFRHKQAGRAAKQLLPELVSEALNSLPIPKRMRWGDMDAEFVRPVHWLVLLHGNEVVPANLLSLKSGRVTRGHRFHYPKPISLRSADDYPAALEKAGHVIAAFDKRRERIRQGIERLAQSKGGNALYDDALLDEVTALVEWPQPLIGNVDREFLEVPPEPLVTTMRDNQKYFAVTKKDGTLLPHFITVANVKSRSPARIREGNERVLRARFADAKFFWDTDRKIRLEDRVAGLADVVFHVKLGSLADKCGRVSWLAGVIAAQLGADRSAAERAARLSKADLMSGMVGEFPELQGIMGRYYAAHDGEARPVAAAMAEQYLPRYAGDELPATGVGQSLAIADRLDTITGIFGVGEAPTGDKDPFALRRAALGVLRTIIERGLELDLVELLNAAVGRFDLAFESGGTVEQVYGFMMDRLRAYYQDAGISADVFEAVRTREPRRPLDFDRRVRAVMAFRELKEAESLTAANKRIRNILRQAGTVPVATGDDATLLTDPAERALATRVDELAARVAPLFERGDYTAALRQLAGLRATVDKFFDDVMVMVDDERLRGARLRLLDRLSELFLRVADLSKLQG